MNDNRPKQIDGFSKFLWWLATADAEILKDCPTDKERYRIIGIAVLVTWLFATLAWGYFFSTVVEDDLVIAGLALFFGFAILSIDRSLIAAMSRNGGKPQFLPVAFRYSSPLPSACSFHSLLCSCFSKKISTRRWCWTAKASSTISGRSRRR